jgi:exodeoxyribonuclease V alpha subunit
LRDIQLAYCLSIHKAQGSEYPCVITIIHKAHSFQHHRNLFYTAVTRARETAIILGDHWGICDCARKHKVDMRQTFLSLWPGVAELQVWSERND